MELHPSSLPETPPEPEAQYFALKAALIASQHDYHTHVIEHEPTARKKLDAATDAFVGHVNEHGIPDVPSPHDFKP